MAWFKVDDKFHAAQEVKELPRDIRAPAIGLWTLAGAWSADLLKDGFVPMFMVDELGGTIESAKALVSVKLWAKVRGGYQFRNWEKYQPTRAQVESNRKAESDRKADYRARMAVNTGARPANVPRDKDGRPGHPDPTRPDPTIDNSSTRDHSSNRATKNEDEYSQIVDKPVDNYPAALHKVASMLTLSAGRDVSPLEAGLIVDWILARAKKPPVSITRYVVAAIKRDEFTWTKYLHDGKLPE